MRSTADRLRDLEAADFDTFGEDDKGSGGHVMVTPEEVVEIRKVLTEAPWLDPARYPDCLLYAFDALAGIAVLDTPAANDASQALRWIANRVEVQPLPAIPRGEVV